MRRALYTVLAVLVGLWIVCPLKIGVVLGSSMNPTLRNHQVIVIHQDWYRHHPVEVGDVVVLNHNSDMLVKRVRAVGGERLWELRDPALGSYGVVNGSSVRRMEDALRRSPAIGSLHCRRIPAGYVYVLGDDSPSSYDSRSFGPVPISEITGRVLNVAR